MHNHVLQNYADSLIEG